MTHALSRRPALACRAALLLAIASGVKAETTVPLRVVLPVGAIRRAARCVRSA